ncbi:MAG: hydroxyethylthiazole kinase [Bacillus sp. (in: firmicutes)]
MSLRKIREAAPLVHCLTNYVVAHFTANGLLAVGASPVMADEANEVEDMAANADSLLLNIGTINVRTAETMLLAGKKANESGKPVVFDPVGVGATSYRRQVADSILQNVKIDLLRCNAGELAAIAGVTWHARGVESGAGEMDIGHVAQSVAQTYGCLVAVTGREDCLSDGEQTVFIEGGVEQMTAVTGTGCLLSAICTAALASEGDRFTIVEATLKDYKKAAELAGGGKIPVGTFQMQLLNSLQVLSGGEHQ